MKRELIGRERDWGESKGMNEELDLGWGLKDM